MQAPVSLAYSSCVSGRDPGKGAKAICRPPTQRWVQGKGTREAHPVDLVRPRGLTQQVDLLPCPVSPSELQATLPQCQPAFSSQSPLWPHTACLPRGPCSPGGQGPGIPTEEGPRATQGGLGARPSPVRLPRCSAVPEASGGTKASGAARSSSLEPPLSMSQPQVFWLKGGLWADVGGTHSTKVGHWATASHGYCS